MKRALLINGPPASGKTTLGIQIARRLSLPFLSRDTVKEVLFDAFGIPDREMNRELGRTSLDIIWALAAEFPEDVNVIIEAWFGAPPHDEIVAGLHRAGFGQVAELWCHAPGEVLAARYGKRVNLRHPGHPDASFGPELAELAPHARPMGLGPLLEVDTTDLGKVNIPRVQEWVTSTLDLQHRSGRLAPR